VVTAQKELRNLLKNPYTESYSLLPAISTITSDQIRKQGANTVIEALNYVTGGLTETRGRQVKQFFSVRGQKYPYPDYAVNGVWQQEFQELSYFFSASDIEEIEIARSSAALLTGLSGMAGLINIKTKEYTVPEINADLEYGSYNSFHGHVSNGGKFGSFGYRAGIGYDKSDGPAGKHAKESMGNFNTSMDWQLSDKLGLKATLFYLDGKRQLRIAEPPADKKYLDMLQSFDPYRALISNLKISYRPTEKLSTEVQLFYSYRNPTFNDEAKSTASNEKDSEMGVNIMQSILLSRSNTLRLGGLYNRWIAPNGKRFYTGKRCDTETFSGVVVDEQQVGHFTFDAGIRWTKTFLNEYAAFNIEGEGGQFKNVTPIIDSWEPGILQTSLGTTWRSNNTLSFYFNAAAGQIQPRRGALNENLQELKNESRLKIDVSTVKKFGESGKMTLTAFWVLQENAIALSGTTYKDPISGMIRELYVNRGQNQRGLEYEIVSPRLFNLINPFLNFTWMKSEMKKDGSMVRNKENPIFISSGGIYLEKHAMDLNFLCKYVSAFENQRFASVSAGPQPLGDFVAMDVTGGYTFKSKVPLRCYFKVQNVTDKRYSTVIGYPDFGRIISLGINVSIK
jgi:iron complex outermembrane receptor protein